MPEPIASFIGALQGWLFQAVVLPVLVRAGALQYTEDAFNGTEEFVLGALEIVVLLAKKGRQPRMARTRRRAYGGRRIRDRGS